MVTTATVKRMATSLFKIISNIVPADKASVKSFSRSFYVAGDDSAMSITSPGVPTLNMVADPKAKLGSSFYVVDDGCDAIGHFIESVNEDNIVKTKIGRKAIEDEVITLIRKHRDTDIPQSKALEVECRPLLAALHALVKETQAIVPIDNLVLSGLEELVVGKVKFRPCAQAAPEMQQELAQGLSNKSEAERDMTNKLFEDTVLPHYKSSPTCAEVTLSAEQSRVTELVDSEVDASLNLLRCYTHLLFPRDARAFIGLKGAVTGNTRPCVDFSTDGFHINLQNVGMFFPYAMTPDKLQHLVRHCSFDELSAVLGKPEADRTQIERVIVTAIRWLGRSVNASDVPEQVLSLAIALERLMIPDSEQGGKADNLAQRLAFLVGDNVDNRMAIYERGKKLYRLRSDVVHDGKTLVSVDDLQNLENYSCMALVKMAQHLTEWQTHNDFVYWAKRHTFS